jgi:hypothetical protein
MAESAYRVVLLIQDLIAHAARPHIVVRSVAENINQSVFKSIFP